MFDCFLELDGIKGESIDKTHKDKMFLTSFSWSGNQTGTMHKATGGGAGKAAFADITVTKKVDKATPTLWQYMATGKHIAKGTLFVRKAGETPKDYMTVKMENILVSNVSFGGSSGGEDEVTEHIGLNFASFTLSYSPQDAKGNLGAAVDFKFNIAQNA